MRSASERWRMRPRIVREPIAPPLKKPDEVASAAMMTAIAMTRTAMAMGVKAASCGWGRCRPVPVDRRPRASCGAQRVAHEGGGEGIVLGFDGVVVPADDHGEVLAGQVPELGVGAESVGAVAPHRVLVDRAVGEPEAVARPEPAVAEARHRAQRPGREDVAAQQGVTPAGQRRYVTGQAAGGAGDRPPGAAGDERPAMACVYGRADALRVEVWVHQGWVGPLLRL